MQRFVLLLYLLIYCPTILWARPEKNTVDSVAFYGSMRVHGASYKNNFEIQENAPRLGLDLYRKINNTIIISARLEYGIHITDGINFSNDANSSAAFIAMPSEKRDPFTARLSYLGFAYKNWGQISIGKQWGVYYDIAEFTDKLSPFGGSSLGVYAGGTDGGWKGTGRADRSVQYRNTIGKLQLGLQTQLFAQVMNYGASLRYQITAPITIGMSYNRANISTHNEQFVQNIGSYSDNIILGTFYKSKKIYGALSASYNDDKISVINDSTAISFPTLGGEYVIRYKINNYIFLLNGGNFNKRIKEVNNTYPNDYRLNHIIVGLDYYFTPDTKIYAVSRLSNSKNTNFSDQISVHTLGFRYDFNYSKKNNQISLN